MDAEPEMQRDAEGPMRMDGKSKKKMSAEDSVSWRDSGKRSGMKREPTGTLQHAIKLFRDDENIKKINRNKGDSRMPPDPEVGQQPVTTSPEEAVNSCESPLPAICSGLPPEFREKLKALLHIQDKLISKETAKIQVDKRSENQLGRKKRFEMSPEEEGRIAEEMAQELETFQSHRRLWEDKWSKTSGGGGA